ncbi:hypothetical protein HAX54_036252, partial [Datura stramonium]|nr:hypothetical protein [Datura stramonium]
MAKRFLDVRTAFGAINLLRSYDAANTYGDIDCLWSYDAILLTELLNSLWGHIEVYTLMGFFYTVLASHTLHIASCARGTVIGRK